MSFLPLTRFRLEKSSFRSRENIQTVIWSWWTEERVQLHHDFCGEFERACDMVHGLLSIIHQNERILSKGFMQRVASQETKTYPVNMIHPDFFKSCLPGTSSINSEVDAPSICTFLCNIDMFALKFISPYRLDAFDLCAYVV